MLDFGKHLPRIRVFSPIVLRAILFLVVLLLVLPSILSLFVSGTDFEAKVRTVFLLQKLYLFTALSTLLLIFLVRPKKLGVGSFGKRNLQFAFLSLVFFALAFSTQLDIDRTLVEGASIVSDQGSTSLDLDYSRYIAPAVLSDLVPSSAHFIEKDGEFFMKIINLDEAPRNEIEVRMLAVWTDANNQRFNSELKLVVNDEEFDATKQFRQLPRGKSDWIGFFVPASAFKKGQNTIVLRMEKARGEKVGVYIQATYFNNNSFIFNKGMYRNIGMEYHEYLWFLNTPNNPFFSIVFKLGFVFRLFGILFLFLAVFGLGFFKQLLFEAKKELVFSTLFAYIVYWFSVFLQGYWRFFSSIVTQSIYWIYKLMMLDPVMNLNNPSFPRLGIRGFVVAITETCSGVESMGYFLIAYTALIAFNWHKIRHERALLLYLPGLFGIFAVNILRVALILLIGAFYSREFALNAFHTNAAMFMFIIYFIIFWPLAMRFIRKE